VGEKARKSLFKTLREVKKLIPFDQLLSAACNDPDNFRASPELRPYLAEVKDCLGDDINRIAQRLAQCPDWQPRMRPNRNGSVHQTATSALLNESLLVPPK
jgi:hypothetical protein